MLNIDTFATRLKRTGKALPNSCVIAAQIGSLARGSLDSVKLPACMNSYMASRVDLARVKKRTAELWMCSMAVQSIRKHEVSTKPHQAPR